MSVLLIRLQILLLLLAVRRIPDCYLQRVVIVLRRHMSHDSAVTLVSALLDVLYGQCYSLEDGQLVPSVNERLSGVVTSQPGDRNDLYS